MLRRYFGEVLLSLAVAVGIGAQPAAAESSNGTICIASVPRPTAGGISLGNPTGGNRVFDLSVQIDDGPLHPTSHDKGVRVAGLSTKLRHLVKIRNQNRLLHSFYFNFAEYKSKDLCLWFKPLYETWSLWTAKDARGLCDCSDKKVSVAPDALLPVRAAALRDPEYTNPAKNQNGIGDDEIEVTVSSANGNAYYLRTSFGRLPDGKLRSNCIEDKDIPLPIELGHAWRVPLKRFPGGALSEVIYDEEVLLEPIDPVEGTNALHIGDLMITDGPMAGKWSYKSCTTLKQGVLVKWTQEDKSSLQAFIPWAGIYSKGIDRSQFDAPLCREENAPRTAANQTAQADG